MPNLEILGRDLMEAAKTRPDGADEQRERSGRRAQGAFFTPAPLVQFVVRETLETRLCGSDVTWREDGTPALRILDPSAGDGRFLAAAADYLAGVARERGHDPDAARAAIIRRCLVGIERDAEFADAARARLGESATIYCREALLDPPPQAQGVDAVIGNPPYLRSVHLARTDHELWAALHGRYAATSYGEWDLYAAFIEQSLDWVGPRGEVGLVVPSRWFTAAFAAPLREKLGHASAVRALVHFGDSQIFSDVTTYAAVVFLSRSPVAEVTVAKHSWRGWQYGQLKAAELTSAPWRLSVGPRRTLMERLSKAGPRLGRVARVAKGVGTNADSVYVLERAEVHDGLVSGWSKAAAERVTVEASACKPCVRGRDVRPYGRVTGAVQVIVPYKPSGILWNDARLAEHPLVCEYLSRFREQLEERERGKYRGARYYRFGRPQNMAFLSDTQPKIIIPDVTRKGRALIDDSGAMVLDTAYAVRLQPEAQEYDLEIVLAVLNSPMVNFWLEETGILLRGGYMRLKTAYLDSLPLPPPSRTAGVRAAVREGLERGRVDASAVNEAVREAYDIDLATWEDIAATRPSR